MLAPKTLAGFVAVVTFTVAANLMLKLGAGAPKPTGFSGCSAGGRSRGSLCSVAGGIGYAFLLRRVAPNIAQVCTSAQFVGVVVAASLVLGEPISAALWLGTACIGFGLALVGATENV